MGVVAAVRPKDIFTADEWAALTRVSPWRGLWLVAHAWGSIAIIIAIALWVGHWIAFVPAIFLIGGRQLGLAILMHDAAHGLLHPHRATNNFVGQWLAGAAVGSELAAYRTYHLAHHRYTQQAEDPDLALSAPFPTSRASLWRKVFRDLSGQTFAKQRSVQFALAAKGLWPLLRGGKAPRGRDASAGTILNRSARDAGPAGMSAPASETAAISIAKSTLRFLLVQAILLSLSLLIYGWTPFLLWLAALATSFQLALRIRNIAEHACTQTGPGDPFSHARTTRASWAERMLLAPYWVNYHAEHHLFMGVPAYRLVRVHRLLVERGFGARMMIAENYASVLRLVTSPAV